MNTLEIDAIAQGIINHIKSATTSPLEGIAILGIALVKLYDSATEESTLPFAKFAADFHASLIATRADVSNAGPLTRQ